MLDSGQQAVDAGAIILECLLAMLEIPFKQRMPQPRCTCCGKSNIQYTVYTHIYKYTQRNCNLGVLVVPITLALEETLNVKTSISRQQQGSQQWLSLHEVHP